MSDMGVFDVLRKAFIYVAYPAVIIAFFLVIAVRMRVLFQEYHADRLVQWRLAVAGLLPVAVLTFVVVGEFPESVVWLPTADHWEIQLPLGAAIAVATLEASQQVSGTRQALTFMLYLSTLGTGLLYVVMEGELARFQPAVFAVVVAGGLHFVFREPESTEDESLQPIQQVQEDEPAAEHEGTCYAHDGFARLRQIEKRIKRQQARSMQHR
jgi:hypothetical protein